MSALASPLAKRPGWWIAADLLAAAIVGVAQFDLALPAQELAPIRAGMSVPLLVLFAGAMAIPIAVRRMWPVAALEISLSVCAVMLAFGIPAAVGPASPLALILLGIAYSCPRRTAVLALGVTLVVLAVDAWAGWQDGLVWNPAAVSNVALVIVVAWCAAFLTRQQRERAADQRERAADQRERAVELAVRQERLRIARELHDVVAHGLTAVAVQSGYARRVLDSQPDQARGALEAIQATSRDAIADLRRMLGPLRDISGGQSEPAERAPSPGLADLDAVLARAAAAGLRVILTVDGERRPLPPGVELTAYRIIQESLTNVIKHASTAVCGVRLEFGDADLRIEITDDGPPRAADPRSPGVVAPGHGHGLLGMRERVTIYGGELDAGPQPERGFRVAAQLPVPARLA